jgi:4-diphosphocytidyl-2-C-methyl-D-erythritol kinase
MSELKSVAASAPGKTNLFFAVGPLMDDGFHEVASVYLALDLREEISVSLSDSLNITVSGSIPQNHLDAVPLDSSNLVVKAADFVAAVTDGNLSAERLSFDVTKNVPVAGGMGGGSADAAAALLAVAELWQNTAFAADEDMVASTVVLGADVPFALRGGVCVGLGRGEKLTEISGVSKLHLVLVTSEQGLSTPAVYQRLDELRAQRGEDPRKAAAAEVGHLVIDALKSGDLALLADHLRNDLQEAALDLRPDLKETIDAGLAAGALTGFVSGSGPTIAFLAADHRSAENLATTLRSQGRAAIATSGPSVGAFIREEH